MPRKKKIIDENIETPKIKKNKKNIMTTMIKEINTNEEHIILQLPLSKDRIDSILSNEKNINNIEPMPYEPNISSTYHSELGYKDSIIGGELNNIQTNIIINDKNTSNKVQQNQKSYIDNINTNNKCCFWCIHPIPYSSYGMPISYDNITDTYISYGYFCSLQCANAYNFSIHNGSDKVWEINSMIQRLGKIYNMEIPIRPAPSRYLLNIFTDGELSIEEYRNLHSNRDSSHILNLPPMITLSSGYEIANTSYIKTLSDNIKNSIPNIGTNIEGNNKKGKINYNMNNKFASNNIDSKLNLIVLP
tara:strand:- start:7633 stop:8544 length:912 start_codon:yes stop_codon:yes gene_type:complete